MSFWTHIVATLDVETYIYDKDVKTRVEELLKDAPEITGSEGSADVFVNVLSGYNCSTNMDCLACQYKDTRKLYDDGFECDAPEGYKCPHGEYQTRVVITVIGDLRDRMRQRTRDEWYAFKKYIEKSINNDGFTIRNCSCNIIGWQ